MSSTSNRRLCVAGAVASHHWEPEVEVLHNQFFLLQKLQQIWTQRLSPEPINLITLHYITSHRENGSRLPRPLYLRYNTKMHYMIHRITTLQYYSSGCHGDLLCNHTVHPDQTNNYIAMSRDTMTSQPIYVSHPAGDGVLVFPGVGFSTSPIQTLLSLVGIGNSVSLVLICVMLLLRVLIIVGPTR